MPKYIVYTCITKKYDWLLPPLCQEPGIKYICFTDTPDISPNGWEIMPVSESLNHLPPNFINRHYKLFPHLYLPESKWSVYVDGNIRILSNIQDLIYQVRDKGAVMGCPRHPLRDNIKDEIEACFRLNKFSENDKKLIDKQLEDYLSVGMPNNAPLSANYIIVRNHSDRCVQEAMQLWWDQLQRYTKRDQISLPFVVWKKVVPFTLVNCAESDSEDLCYFVRVQHRRQGVRGILTYIQARRFDGRLS